MDVLLSGGWQETDTQVRQQKLCLVQSIHKEAIHGSRVPHLCHCTCCDCSDDWTIPVYAGGTYHNTVYLGTYLTYYSG